MSLTQSAKYLNPLIQFILLYLIYKGNLNYKTAEHKIVIKSQFELGKLLRTWANGPVIKIQVHHLRTKSPPKQILQENQSKTAKLKAAFQVGATSKRH